MKTLIIGLGKSGRGAARFLLKRKEEVVGFDDRISLLMQEPEILALKDKGLLLASSSDLNLSSYQRVVLSPGVACSHPLVQEAQRQHIPIQSELALGLSFLKGTSLAVTGSNGKTTVTLLTTHILQKAGYHAVALGNVGRSLTSYLAENSSPEIAVVEVSSFQLETMQGEFFDAALLLNITPDHMDRYSHVIDYAKTKIHLQDCLKKGGILYLPQALFHKYASFFQKEKICCFDEDGEEELFQRLRGEKKEKEKSNLLACYYLSSHLHIAERDVAIAYQEFQKPAHRMEFVAEINGISFYNDSKATNVESVLYALKAIEGKAVLIAGGQDKGLDYHIWKDAFQGKVKKVVLFGMCRDKIASALQGIPLQLVASLKEAVSCAYISAEKGDNVLLSPGCSSYDMFKNYEHRGDAFKDIVRILQREEKVR